MTRFDYNDRGQLTRTWGNAAYPARYVYDPFGRLHEMHTWRTGTIWNDPAWPTAMDGSQDITTWNYQDSTGLLTSKVDDATQSVLYTYTYGGRLKTRTWARDSGSIFTTYNYDPNTAELINILYSDITMTDISFTYDRLGRQDTITDALGGRDFDYSTGLQLETETITGLYNKTITREYDTTTVIGRYEGLNTGVEYQISYGYDTAGRLNAVSYNSNGTVTGTATYGYLNNSGLIETLTTTTGQVSTYGYEPDRNLRTQVWNQFNGATVSQYDSGYNAAGQRTSVLNVGTAFAATAFNRFDYNDRSERKESSRYLGNNIYDITQPVQSEYRHYEYDPIGNRSGITEASNNGSYISNNLNQYTTETPPGGGSNTYVHDE
ncbi:MAG: hypothetical protein K8S27_05275, partial [Candidatus Omnitrophica bacterium]|nr:hypothetical protein [Candidatus Omnitrophota bacterium]